MECNINTRLLVREDKKNQSGAIQRTFRAQPALHRGEVGLPATALPGIRDREYRPAPRSLSVALVWRQAAHETALDGTTLQCQNPHPLRAMGASGRYAREDFPPRSCRRRWQDAARRGTLL